MDDLEVLDGGLRHPSVEVEHVRLSLFVPRRGFVHQGHQLVRVVVRVTEQDGLKLLEQVESVPVKSITTINIIGTGFFSKHTCFGRMETCSSFSNIPGTITVIFLGPLNPSTFVSWNTNRA